ncbi:hypothetical protein B0H14DRAFT_3142294 [Mycena olivaceomarginata]|nr:hypothetical protein B0H14DRAFT_3142294 [Mycena olivaceomarginata]
MTAFKHASTYGEHQDGGFQYHHSKLCPLEANDRASRRLSAASISALNCPLSSSTPSATSNDYQAPRDSRPRARDYAMLSRTPLATRLNSIARPLGWPAFAACHDPGVKPAIRTCLHSFTSRAASTINHSITQLMRKTFWKASNASKNCRNLREYLMYGYRIPLMIVFRFNPNICRSWNTGDYLAVRLLFNFSRISETASSSMNVPPIVKSSESAMRHRGNCSRRGPSALMCYVRIYVYSPHAHPISVSCSIGGVGGGLAENHDTDSGPRRYDDVKRTVARFNSQTVRIDIPSESSRLGSGIYLTVEGPGRALSISEFTGWVEIEGAAIMEGQWKLKATIEGVIGT